MLMRVVYGASQVWDSDNIDPVQLKIPSSLSFVSAINSESSIKINMSRDRQVKNMKIISE